MKRATTLLIIACICSITLFSQQPWQTIQYTTIREAAQFFRTPPPENSITLWWGWDGPVDEAVIMRDLDLIKSFGYNAVMLEAGYGMKQPYLSDGWFRLVAFAVEQAKLRNMRVWIEDEGKYPSGFAGGKFSTDRPDLRMQALVQGKPIELAGGVKINTAVSNNVLAAAAISDDNEIVLLPVTGSELNWKAPQGNWKVFTVSHLYKTSPTRSVNNPTRGKDTTASLFDFLNPEATRQFLEWTHAQYFKYFGHEFGKTFMGIMGDEPDFSFSHIPWTPSIKVEFMQRKGYDVTPYLATFHLKPLPDSLQRIKADYWDVWSDLFKENFFDVQAEWCRQHNIEYIVHLNHEDKAARLVRSEGDYFKQMRNVGVPGVDAIWSQIWMDHVADYPKLASSAAHLFGKPRAFTESFAAYTYKPTVAQAKWVMDYQLVRGINLVQNMFWMSTASGHTPDPLPFFMTDTFPQVAAYINRTSTLLTQGKPAAQLALYYPTTSLWLGNDDADTSVLEIARDLLEMQRDFDFIDEQALTGVLMQTNEGLRNLSDQYYHAIIIPEVSVLSERAYETLKEFASHGGSVIFMGAIPSVLYDKTFNNITQPLAIKGAVVEESGRITQKVLDALPAASVKFDKAAPTVKYTQRTLPDAEVYFFFNEGYSPVNVNATIKGAGSVEEWDPFTGNNVAVSITQQQAGYQQLNLALGKWESKILVVINEAKAFNITGYGAVGDNHTVNTKAIQATIDDCYAKGGGNVVVPAGIFRTGSIFLKDKVNLVVEEGGVLKGTTNIDDYPQIPTRFEGIDRMWTAALVNVMNTTNTTITGKGTIDGSGTEWPYLRPQTHQKTWIGRPRLVCFQNCTNATISDLHLLNHAAWCVHILYSKDVIVRNLNIRAAHNIPSSDGIDLDSSSEIYVSNCDIDVNDDCISIKAGKDSSGLAVNRPCENIIIENCRFGYGHGGVACGSETSGGIRNVLVKNCIADSGNWAPIRFKTQPSRGGFVENVTFENITITDAKQAFELLMAWRMVPPVLPPARVLPVFRNLTFKNVTGKVERLGVISGLKESPVTGVKFIHCRLTAKTGLKVENTINNDYSGLQATVAEGELIIENKTE